MKLAAVLQSAGALLVAGGVGLWSTSAGLVVGGLGLVGFGVARELRSKRAS